MATDTQRTVEAVWRMESAKVIASLARILRDVGLAEEIAHDALVAALEQWPANGRDREASTEFERAAGLTRNAREHKLLLERAEACARASAPPASP